MAQPPKLGVIVFERRPFWGPELKRKFTDQAVLVHECRIIRDVLPAADQFAQSIALIVLDATPADCLTWIGQQFQGRSAIPYVAVASSDLMELEWAIREAGAASFVHDEISGTQMARICLRMLRRTASLPPRVAAGS